MQSIPDHTLLRQIGSGSYGHVWLARNLFGGYRAVKIITAATEDQERHLEREFEGIRKFEPISRSHPGFVDVLHAGHDPDRRFFYYVMELGDDLVSGQEIFPDRYVPKTLSSEIKTFRRLPVADCVGYGVLLSDALRDLHEKGLIHRDIKPGNIIFINGTPKLADIGLVTQIDEANSYVGTEGFIPPEGPTSVQADVYALGKVLYEMATGRDRKEFPAFPADLNELPDATSFLELNEVIIRACHTDRARRYPSAGALSEELSVLQQGTSIKRLRWLEKRWRTAKRAVLALGLVVVLGSILGFPFLQQQQMKEQSQSRQAGRLIAEVSRLVQVGNPLEALPLLVQAIDLDAKHPDRTRTHWLRAHSLFDHLPALSALQFRSKGVASVDWSPDGQRLVTAEFYGKATIWNPDTDQTSKPFGPGDGLQMVRFSPDGRWIATADHNKSARIYDAQTQEVLYRFEHARGVYSATFSHDGRQLVTACRDGSVTVFDLASGTTNFVIAAHTNAVTYAAFSPDNQLIVSTSFDGTARLWLAVDGRPVGEPLPHPSWVFAAAFSPDGTSLVTACFDRFARVWDLDRRQMIRPALKHNGGIRACAFSQDGAWILTASYDSTVRLWTTVTQEPELPVAVLPATGQLHDLAISPDGHRIAVGCEDGTVRVWDMAAVGCRPSLTLNTYPTECDRSVAVKDQTRLQLVDSRNSVLTEWPLRSTVVHVAVNTDASVIAAVIDDSAGRAVTVWNVATPASPVFSLSDAVDRVVLNGSGSALATLSSNRVAVYQISPSNLVFQADLIETKYHEVVFAPAGTELILINHKTVQMRSVDTGTLRFPDIKHPGNVQRAVFSHNGRRFVTACNDDQFSRFPARVFDAATGAPVGHPLTHRDGVLSAAFSPDDRRVITCGEDFSAIVWDVMSSQPILVLEHSDQVQDADYSGDGKWIVTASNDGLVRVWDAATGEAVTPFFSHPDKIQGVRFIRDGQFLLASDGRGRGWLHSLPTAALPWADLKLSADLVAGKLSVGTNRATDSGAPDLRSAWQSCAGRFPFLERPNVSVVGAWHRRRVRLLSETGNTTGAAFHEQRLNELGHVLAPK